ncbi:hypothetical protein G9F32_02945 [Acinetobacter sp. 194]|uniref:hypothetical protein n=1 Tax=Acinetobacter shaoyimingii TaxID=2715164 RepID=UPI00140D8A80|nr:hypothetical protein [Acinetobacter shaoyimingii]NHB56992.1 hypothetical protein [Acinetobacter shaoyimingii]
MTNSNFCKPFRELIKNVDNKIYYVRLGPKTYIVKSETKLDDFFQWSIILVIDPKSDQPRAITSDELAVTWLKPNLKAVVNYSKASQPPSKKLVLMRHKAKREAREKYATSWKSR